MNRKRDILMPESAKPYDKLRRQLTRLIVAERDLAVARESATRSETVTGKKAKRDAVYREIRKAALLLFEPTAEQKGLH